MDLGLELQPYPPLSKPHMNGFSYQYFFQGLDQTLETGREFMAPDIIFSNVNKLTVPGFFILMPKLASTEWLYFWNNSYNVWYECVVQKFALNLIIL